MKGRGSGQGDTGQVVGGINVYSSSIIRAQPL